MELTRHATPDGPRWAVDGRFLPAGFGLGTLLELPQAALGQVLRAIPTGDAATGPRLAPLEPDHEVWASGVTYIRSREARRAESETADIYEKVYDAERPELFFKSPGWRTVGSGVPVRIRRDSRWNVPEPELVLVLNRLMEIVGYTAGNDMSSRDIEGGNPLYLPQAKIYDGSCAVGPSIRLATAAEMGQLRIRLEIRRGGSVAFEGDVSTAQIKRPLEELASYLGRELRFPHGALLMTGTGIVPPEEFTLQVGDLVRIDVGELSLENPIAS
jgi:2-dehydro-3-deoxy-D-arabinonate dehydratase